MSEENNKKSNDNNLIFEEIENNIKILFEKFNNSLIVLDEIEDWNGVIQFNLEEKFYFNIYNSGQQLVYFRGKADNPDCSVIMPSEIVNKLFSGDFKIIIFFEAMMNNKMKINGSSSHFMKLTSIIEYFEDEKLEESKVCEDDWIVEAPEDHDMKSDLLNQAAKNLKKLDINRNSFLVVRHGVLVFEEYYGRRSYKIRQRMHYNIASVTKTIAALVVGVAITKGLFTVDDLITDWIPDPAKGIVPGSKIKHLLTQTSETEPPGTKFKYNSRDEINTLGKIITKAAGMPSKDFAKESLFDPLGIHEYSWNKVVAEKTDLPIGSGMKISPRDAARLSQLFLSRGKWDGNQIISEQYIDEMIKPSFLDVNSGYGYLVWLNNSLGKWNRPFKNGTGRMIPNAPEDMFMATGFFGRFIFVIPSLDVIVVTFGKKFVMESLDTAREIYNIIEPALPSE